MDEYDTLINYREIFLTVEFMRSTHFWAGCSTPYQIFKIQYNIMKKKILTLKKYFFNGVLIVNLLEPSSSALVVDVNLISP